MLIGAVLMSEVAAKLCASDRGVAVSPRPSTTACSTVDVVTVLTYDCTRAWLRRGLLEFRNRSGMWERNEKFRFRLVTRPHE